MDQQELILLILELMVSEEEVEVVDLVVQLTHQMENLRIVMEEMVEMDVLL
jgi:hypothetical protein